MSEVDRGSMALAHEASTLHMLKDPFDGSSLYQLSAVQLSLKLVKLLIYVVM